MRQYKQTVDAQLTHGVSLTYVTRRDPTRLSFSLDGSNITDAKVYDFFGVQRPGRAFYAKVTAEL